MSKYMKGIVGIANMSKIIYFQLKQSYFCKWAKYEGKNLG